MGDTLRPFIRALTVAAALLSAPLAAKEKADNLDYGYAPSDPLEAAKTYFAGVLKDPYSADFRLVGSPYPGVCRGGLAGEGWHGWAAHIAINAKNSYGAYTGFQVHTVLYKNGAAVRAIEGADFGAYGPAKGMLGLGGGAGVCRKKKA